MSTGEVARLFRVNAETVRRWANRGRLPHTRLPSGRRLFRTADVHALYHDRSRGYPAHGVDSPASPTPQ